jgi:hypothetical protein
MLCQPIDPRILDYFLVDAIEGKSFDVAARIEDGVDRIRLSEPAITSVSDQGDNGNSNNNEWKEYNGDLYYRLPSSNLVAKAQSIRVKSKIEILKQSFVVNKPNSRIVTITSHRQTETCLLEVWNSENGDLLWSYARELGKHTGRAGLLADFSPNSKCLGFHDNGDERNLIHILDVSATKVFQIGALRCPDHFHGAERLAS